MDNVWWTHFTWSSVAAILDIFWLDAQWSFVELNTFHIPAWNNNCVVLKLYITTSQLKEKTKRTVFFPKMERVDFKSITPRMLGWKKTLAIITVLAPLFIWKDRKRRGGRESLCSLVLSPKCWQHLGLGWTIQEPRSQPSSSSWVEGPKCLSRDLYLPEGTWVGSMLGWRAEPEFVKRQTDLGAGILRGALTAMSSACHYSFIWKQKWTSLWKWI